MIKLLPITSCTQCHLRGLRKLQSHSWRDACTNFNGGRDIENINVFPEWCPLDDAEVEKQ